MHDATRDQLQQLRDRYVEAVNVAVGEDRGDLVEELVATYPDAALRVLTSTETEHDRAPDCQ